MLESIAAGLDWFGIVVFATTGALTASRKQLDIFGFVLLATVTGIGGGTLRDVVLGTLPVFWVSDPTYLIVCAGVASILFFTAHIPESRYRLLLWLDSVGLALFAVTGAQKALEAGADSIVAVAMGAVTATFGGIIRDVLGDEPSVILRPEVYVSAALLGAVVFVAAAGAGFAQSTSMIAGFVAGFALRAAALYWSWSLPRYRSRPGR